MAKNSPNMLRVTREIDGFGQVTIQTVERGPEALVRLHLGRLLLALELAQMDVSINTVIDPLTGNRNRNLQLAHNRGTPEYEALLAGQRVYGVPILDRGDLLPCSAAREYIVDGTFIRSEDYAHLFWATEHFYYPEHRVFDYKVPPAWATQAIYFSK